MDTLSLLPEHTGENYSRVLQKLHGCIEPVSYFEIGTLHGATLALARCASVAIDPAFKLQFDVVGKKPSCQLFQMTSDDFFRGNNLRELFGCSVQMAFLDGMHQYEYLLRDFINLERYCDKDSVVLMHDCLPSDKHIARRDPNDRSLADLSAHPDWWAGDVWKAGAIIRRLRPDLVMLGITTPPTGLIAITSLDPSSDILQSQYSEMVSEFDTDSLSGASVGKFAESIPLFPTEALASSVSSWLCGRGSGA
jgi:hypothetical protein